MKQEVLVVLLIGFAAYANGLLYIHALPIAILLALCFAATDWEIATHDVKEALSEFMAVMKIDVPWTTKLRYFIAVVVIALLDLLICAFPLPWIVLDWSVWL